MDPRSIWVVQSAVKSLHLIYLIDGGVLKHHPRGLNFFKFYLLALLLVLLILFMQLFFRLKVCFEFLKGIKILPGGFFLDLDQKTQLKVFLHQLLLRFKLCSIFWGVLQELESIFSVLRVLIFILPDHMLALGCVFWPPWRILFHLIAHNWLKLEIVLVDFVMGEIDCPVLIGQPWSLLVIVIYQRIWLLLRVILLVAEIWKRPLSFLGPWLGLIPWLRWVAPALFRRLGNPGLSVRLSTSNSH